MGTRAVKAYWDEQAATFDGEPDHGLLEEHVWRAWRDLLLPLVPASGAGVPGLDVADLGCGTGSLSVLLAQHGHRVVGVDLSDAMVAAATRKAGAAGVAAVFRQGDVSAPGLQAASVDVVLSRHVLWAMPDPAIALTRWVRLLRPGGLLLLVEGRWSTGAGLPAADAMHLVRDQGLVPDLQRLSDAKCGASRSTTSATCSRHACPANHPERDACDQGGPETDAVDLRDSSHPSPSDDRRAVQGLGETGLAVRAECAVKAP